MSFQLPPSLDLPPHLSAHKYFFVCTLTVAAWDTLVLSPRTWRLFKTPEWPFLKTLFYILRFLMPIEFAIVAVAFFNTNFTQSQCNRFYLFEPICTAILLATCSAVHVIRISAIYEKSAGVIGLFTALLATQIVVTGVSCAFYFSVPLKEGQGCIAGPKEVWVGIYWVAPTLLYTASFSLAVSRSFQSLKDKQLNLWKLMLRDGLNLYGAIWIVNVLNVCFWFIVKPTGIEDPIRTLVTSMAAVLTTAMSLRIILSVRGTLVSGGSFTGNLTGQSSSRGTRVVSTNRSTTDPRVAPTYTLDDMRTKPESEWIEDTKSSVTDRKGVIAIEDPNADPNNIGVKITINREVGYDGGYPQAK